MKTVKKDVAAASVGGMLLAFLATQHHNLHMILLTLGLGGSTLAFMQAYPSVRRGMLLVSLAIVALNLRSLRRAGGPGGMRLAVLGFSVLTVVIAAWSVVRLGL